MIVTVLACGTLLVVVAEKTICVGVVPAMYGVGVRATLHDDNCAKTLVHPTTGTTMVSDDDS